MIFTAPIARLPAVQQADGTGITFASGAYTLLATNTAPPGGLTGFRDVDYNPDCAHAYMFGLGAPSTATIDVDFTTHDDDGDLLLIALFIDGDSNSRLYVRRRPEGSSTWGSWTDYTPPIGSDSPTGDHALVRDYPFLLITESDLGNNATLAQIIASNPRALRVGDTEAVLAYRDYGVFVPIARTTGTDGNDYYVEYGLRGFSQSPTGTAYRVSDLSLSGTYPINQCTGSNLEGEITNVDLGEVFCFNNGQQSGLPPGANWGLAYFYRAPDRFIGWNGAAVGELRSNGHVYLDENDGAAGHIRALIPRTANLTALTIRGDAADIDYAVFSRAVAVLHPTPESRSNLAHVKRWSRGIDGRIHAVNQSPDPIFKGNITAEGYGTAATARDITSLDDLAAFGCVPSGLERIAATREHGTDWFQPDYAVNCTMRRFSGVRGAGGIAVNKPRFSMTFEETATI